MADCLTACIVGLGSIGKRHLRNLKTVCSAQGIVVSIDALRHSPCPIDPAIRSMIRCEYFDLSALPHYDLVFICNPSQLHYDALVSLHDKADHIFVEKPLFTRPLTDDELHPFLDNNKYYVACPLRHTRTFEELRKYVSAHPVYSIRAICSSYLPDWRPGVDYRTLYSAREESGGVVVDLVHEFDYLFTLFGIPLESKMFARRVSHLDIMSNDIVAYVASYPDKVLELHLDYFGRNPQRYCEIYTHDEVKRFDFLSGSEDRNASYISEMRYILNWMHGNVPNINPTRFANAVLRAVM